MGEIQCLKWWCFASWGGQVLHPYVRFWEIRDLDDAQDCYPCKTRSLSFDQETAP